MIEKISGRYYLVCDCCGEDEMEFDDFSDAVDYKKANGWRAVCEGGVWQDYCVECKEKGCSRD